MAQFSEQLQDVVAIDGKVLRRSLNRARGKSALHMISAWGGHGHRRHAKREIERLLTRKVQARRKGQWLPLPTTGAILKCDCPDVKPGLSGTDSGSCAIRIDCMVVRVVVPTLNAAADWPAFAPPLIASITPEQVLIIDSSSSDQTVTLAQRAGFRIHTIARSEFNHGATRQLAAEMLPEAEIIVYMTQDAVLTSPFAITHLLRPFSDPSVAATYGRQLPRIGAGAIEAHARNFNYPENSDIRDFASRERLGFKAIFLSNSFAAYRRSALFAVGGFPTQVIFGEDTVTAARFLMAGSKIAYVAEAAVRHSHAYTWRQEFKRYFDIGVLHSRESWLLEAFGGTGGEGKRFVRSEIRYLRHKDPLKISSALVRTGLKLLGYKLGRAETKLSLELKTRLSMHRGFWTAGN